MMMMMMMMTAQKSFRLRLGYITVNPEQAFVAGINCLKLTDYLE